MFADVTSANVVGYQQMAAPANYYNFCGGSIFVNVGKEAYSLDDIKITGPASKSNARNNYIMLMASGQIPASSKARSYWWDYSSETWRVREGTNFNNDTPLTKKQAQEILINPCEGFICCFAHPDTTKITFSGEVVKGNNEKKISITAPTGYYNFIAVNPSGREISLNDIVITGPTSKSNARNNYIMRMASGQIPASAKARTYWWDYSAETWRVREGTNFNNDTPLTKAQAADVTFAPGEGFMCCFAHPDTTVLTVPSAL